MEPNVFGLPPVGEPARVGLEPLNGFDIARRGTSPTDLNHGPGVNLHVILGDDFARLFAQGVDMRGDGARQNRPYVPPAFLLVVERTGGGVLNRMTE